MKKVSSVGEATYGKRIPIFSYAAGILREGPQLLSDSRNRKFEHSNFLRFDIVLLLQSVCFQFDE